MIWVDYIIIGVIAVSAIIGLARGLIREVVSLAVWVLALVAAWLFHQPLAEQFTPWVQAPSVRIGAAVAVIVVAVLVVGAIFAHLMTLLVEKTGLTGTDRLLGMAFGALRGGVVVAFAVFLAELTPIVEDPWWSDSQLLAKFGILADLILDLVPPEITDQIRAI